MHRAPRRRRSWRLAVLLVALAAALAAAAQPQARLALLYLAGRSPLCPWTRALEAEAHAPHTTAIKDRILAASRRLRSDSQGFELWSTPQGDFWIPKDNQYVLPWNLAEQEQQIYGSGTFFAGPGDVVLDCGAHVGVFTRVALQAGASRVIAIEPASENLECLRRNFEREIAQGRVTLVPAGVWNRLERRRLHHVPHNSAANSVAISPAGSEEGEEVPLTTIDRIVEDLALARLDFIKMDIEGAEQNALRGAPGTLRRFRPRLAVAVYHRPDDPPRVTELVRAAQPGYTVQCGPCARAGWSIVPTILYFAPSPP
jgi:FkbM family methyltransferase